MENQIKSLKIRLIRVIRVPIYAFQSSYRKFLTLTCSRKMKNLLKKADYNVTANGVWQEGVTLKIRTNIMIDTETAIESSVKIFHDKTSLSLECGAELPKVDIAYHTYGTLNEKKDNVVWVFHALTGNSEAADWWNGMIGEGKFFDPCALFYRLREHDWFALWLDIPPQYQPAYRHFLW